MKSDSLSSFSFARAARANQVSAYRAHVEASTRHYLAAAASFASAGA